LKPKNTRYPNRKEKADLISYLIEKPWVQFVIIPEENPVQLTQKKIDLHARIQMPIPRNYQIKLFSKLGTGLISRKYENNVKWYQYRILNGQDPLEYDKIKWDYNRWYSVDETLQMTIHHKLPDAIHRLFGMLDAPLAPNLIVTSSYDYHFWASKTVHENEIRFIQTHGGLFAEESIIPSIFAGPDFEKGVEIPFARNVDILPTMLKAMHVDYDPSRLDGNPIKDALKK